MFIYFRKPIFVKNPMVVKMNGTEQDFVHRINVKEETAFHDLFTRFRNYLVLFAIRRIDQLDAAEDIVQEVFFRLWCNRRGLREEGNLAALLYAMAKNLTVNAIRKHKIVETGNVRYYDLHEGRQEPAGESDSDETMRRLRLAVGELPARQRTIFNLKIYESRSNQEIADMLNVSVNTVKVHYARTMKHLCQRLKKN